MNIHFENQTFSFQNNMFVNNTKQQNKQQF